MKRKNARLRNRPIRSSPELQKIINYVKAMYIMNGKKPPTSAEITKNIARKIRKEDLLENEFIPL